MSATSDDANDTVERSDPSGATGQSPAELPPGRRWPVPLWAGLAVLAVLLGLGAWGISSMVPPGGQSTPTATPAPTLVEKEATGTPLVETTPALPVGAATFTPQAGQAATGPRVLGITAGVGMRTGEIAGAAAVAVSFSDNMDHSSTESAFMLAPAVQGGFKWQNKTLFFTPGDPLAPGTTYTVTVGAEAKTGSGASLAAPMSASFKTAPPPSILRTLPVAGASEVPTDTIVTISFNRPMIPLTALESQPDPGQWVSISPQVAGRWVWLGTAAAGFRAETGFLPATDYHVEVKAGWPDAAGVAMSGGTIFNFTTIRPAILEISPSNGAAAVPIDAPVVVRFNQPMEHASTQAAFGLYRMSGSAALPRPVATSVPPLTPINPAAGTPVSGSFAWSADSTVMTFTAGSLLDFGRVYAASMGGQVQAASGGSAVELTGGTQANTWQFGTTGPTQVIAHYPDSDRGPAEPTSRFEISFNNPLAPGQDVAPYLSIDPAPKGYLGQLVESGTGVYTDGVQILANTTYNFSLKAGLKDKWGFPVAPSGWQVRIGPPVPALAIQGGTFQPVYANGPTRVQIDTTNLDKVSLHLYQLGQGDIMSVLENPWFGDPSRKRPGQLKREWDVPASAGNQGLASIYPTIALNAGSDRLPGGYYLLEVTAPTPYGTDLLRSSSVLIVGRTGVVTKSEGENLLIWAADLGSGKPVPNYPLRVEQWTYNSSKNANERAMLQRGRTGADGVWRLTTGKLENVSMTLVWSEQQGDAMFATTQWNGGIDPYLFGIQGYYSDRGQVGRAAIYTDRPIYRPEQVVYFKGIYRQDDDVNYTLPPTGATVQVRAATYNMRGETAVYTGTATLSPVGTLSGQFTLPADAPVGTYTLGFSMPGDNSGNYFGAASTSFDVQEYRKPDFQVNVTSRESLVHGDPLTATVATSYYFGGPLANIATTINLQAEPYYFSWSDPDTGETYTFGEYRPPWIYYSGSPVPGITPLPVQSFKARTDKDGMLTVDVSRYVTTTDGSKSVLIEGQVQDLSNQAVANSAHAVVHQGEFYVGLRVADYLATARQATTITVRTVDSGGVQVRPNTNVSLRFVRREWIAPAHGSNDPWKLNEVPISQASVTTDGKGRATQLFTPPTGGEYGLIAESRDARGNTVRTTMQFWAASSDPGYIPWMLGGEQQVKLVADKEKYEVGQTAHILVTSPFSQATGLLTIERGHLKRYRLVTIQGSAPEIDVPLEAGDLPNVYVGLTLLGNERPPAGAPADWASHVAMRQGYVNVSIDTKPKSLQVSIEPQGKGPFQPGSTANVVVRTLDSSGKPTPGECSLAVVDEAIYALAGDNATSLFDTFWAERGLSVRTSTSFSSGESGGYGGGRGGAGGAVPAAGAPPTAQDSRGMESAGNSAAAPAAPQKVRVDFRDTAFWTASVTTGADGTATVKVPLPDNLTTWRLTTQGVTGDARAGMASTPLTVTQPLLLRPVQPRFLTTGDNPHPQAIIHNNTANSLEVEASLVVSGAITLDAQPPAAQRLSIAPGEQAVVTWSAQVGKGDTANLRYWVHTVDQLAAVYLEDAVATQLPVQAFAAPEAVATSGEVSGTRSDESVFLPYTVNPVLGEMVVQVSPSLAAATTDSINYVKEYPYESTDQTVSRFLPLVVLERVYNDQGLKTPYSSEIPGILSRALRRLGDLQQPDGGWAWWERGPSEWFDTAYVVQGLSAARDAGYAVPGDMLQRGIERLRGFMNEHATAGLDETYHLNMRAYTLYVLAYAVGTQDNTLAQPGIDLAKQAPRMSNHARAWLAMALAKVGRQPESRQVLNSLAAAARQTSTVAHWEEGTPDYWSMGTDNRATALALDALVTLSPGDPLVPKTVRWLMSAEKDGHWLSTQETSISLVALAHYIQQSKELMADYTWQVDAFGKMLGQGVANSANLTQTATLRIPVSQMPQNELGDLALARSSDKGKMYYQVSLRYYVPGEGISARSEGLAVTRSYIPVAGNSNGSPVKEASAGDLLKVRLTIVVTDTSYYVMVTDPLPAGLEGVNGSLNTTSFTERPPDPRGINVGDQGSKESVLYDSWYYRWGPFDNVEMRDDRTVLFANYMGPGTYVYEYYARATTPGVYMALPAHAELMYYPDVFGRSDGGSFTVK